ncbi:hypothetical protein [Cytobacillus firmus]|uniref:hypothetical protein n=1 Tax=Cytobacillus firmus TaxID=1399 RepID=UPI001CFEFBCB|nr:hypothetical protein [Cytobacillus firmus]
MKQQLQITPENKQMILNAMSEYRNGLKGTGQRLFDISFNKIRGMQSCVDLDGMEMIYVTQSLNFYGKQLSASKIFEMATKYRMLASDIERIRIKFQLENGPTVKKNKAASAGTLTA